MKLFQKAAALLLCVILCAAAAMPALATETESTQETEPTQETLPPPRYPTAENAFNVKFTEVNETVYAQASVNIRMGPGTQYTIAGQLRYGFSVTRIGIGDNGWSMVLWQDQVVYIFSLYLSPERPQGYHAKVDDAELLHQMALANSLNRADYTQESWDVLTEALIGANDAMNSFSQPAADDAAKALTEAIAGLVKMDYSRLESALAAVDQLSQTDATTELWYDLVSAACEGQDLLTSGDQAAVDATAEQILSLLTQVRDRIEKMGTPEVVVQEVPVEVPPTDAFCNIPAHRIWPVLFLISLVLNVALVAVIVLYIYNKKKNQQDNTPLVDYDIFDDMD